MSRYCDRYGVSGAEIENLRRRWARIKDDSTWYSFDDFLFWCSEQDYQPRMVLVKKLKSLPHGPDNSSFCEMSEIMKRIKKMAPKKKEISVESEYCKGCQRVCPAGGCADWQKWYQENWNTKIHKNVRTHTTVEFRYEHPDMIREGIIWQPSE